MTTTRPFGSPDARELRRALDTARVALDDVCGAVHDDPAVWFARRCSGLAALLETLVDAAEPLADPPPDPRPGRGGDAGGRHLRRLGGHLSSVCGTDVALAHLGYGRWSATWVDGPTEADLRALTADAVGPAAVERALVARRSTSTRAWAARAVAARRTGTLADAIDACAASPGARGDDPVAGLTAAHHAVLDHVADLLDATAHPDRADEPGDEIAIRRLLGEGRDEIEMTDVLLDHHTTSPRSTS